MIGRLASLGILLSRIADDAECGLVSVDGYLLDVVWVAVFEDLGFFHQ